MSVKTRRPTVHFFDVKRGIPVSDIPDVSRYFRLLFSEGEPIDSDLWNRLCDDAFQNDDGSYTNRAGAVLRHFTLIEGGARRKEERKSKSSEQPLKGEGSVSFLKVVDASWPNVADDQATALVAVTCERLRLLSEPVRRRKCNQNIREGVDPTKLIALTEAISIVKARATATFDETVEIAINLSVDPRHADQMVCGVVNLPNGTGRDVRVAVFARGTKADEAKAAGADVVGAEDLFEIVQGGKIDFDRCVATPDMMPLIARLGKVLGPRGMMPTPKVGTVTMDVAGAVKASKCGAVEFRVEKAGIVQAGIGKASFETKALEENIKAFANAVIKAKPAGAKGNYVKRVAISSTMGPGVKVEPGSILRS